MGGAERRLLSIRDSGKTAVARFEGVNDRSAAKALRGSLVEIDRSSLPPLEEGEYYHADLIGLAAVDRQGNAVGTVVAVENYGAGDLLEIELEDGKRSLIPFKPGNADLEDGRIVLDPNSWPSPRLSPAAGTGSRSAAARAQVVADGRGGDAAFAHRVADLVEAVTTSPAA